MEYEIITIEVSHPKLGKLTKKNIVYYAKGKEISREYYEEGQEVKPGFKLTNGDNSK